MEHPFPAYKGDESFVFVSYSHQDDASVYVELEAMHAFGFNIWYDDGIEPGSVWRDEVALALSSCQAVLFFVSPSSVASAHCRQELNFALTRGKTLICVHLSETELPPGMELTLSDRQAILRHELSESDYRERLSGALTAILDARRTHEVIVEPIAEIDAESADEQSIAVLPLVNRNLDDDLEYLTDGIAEELVRGLTAIAGLRVAPHVRSAQLKDQPITEVAAQLNVRNVVSGSIQRARERLRVNILLSDVTEDRALWSERYDGTLEDVFDFQDDVATRVVDALRLELVNTTETRPIDVGTSNARAYEALLLGRHYFAMQTNDGFNQAIANYRRALELDADYADAYQGVVKSATLQAISYPQAAVVAAEQLEDLMPAIERIDPDRSRLDWDRIEALREGRPYSPGWRALGDARDALSVLGEPIPTSRLFERAMPFIRLAWCASSFGLTEATVELASRFLKTSAADSDYRQPAWEITAYALATQGNFEQAITTLDASLEEDSTRIGAQIERAVLLCRTGQYQRAEADFADLRTRVSRHHGMFAYLYWTGETSRATAYFDELALHPRYPIWLKLWGSLMLADPRLGDVNQADRRLTDALDYLDEGARQKALWVGQTRTLVGAHCTDAVVERLHDSARYQDWLERVGLDDRSRDQFVELVNAERESIGITIAT